MNLQKLSRMDLNLLVSLQALLEEKSVTRAAHQPNHRFCLEDAEGLLRKKLKRYGEIRADPTEAVAKEPFS